MRIRKAACLPFLFLLSGAGFLHAQTPPPEVDAAEEAKLAKAVLSDAEIVNDLNLDTPGLEKVRDAVQKGDFPAAKAAYLDYRRTVSRAQWQIMPSDQPATAQAETDPTGDEICTHYIRNFYYSFDPKGADMGKDFDWTFNPIARTDSAFSDQWTYCAISRTQFWKKLDEAYWKTRNEKYAREWVAELRDFAAKNPVPPAEQGMFGNPIEGPPTLWLALDAGIRMLDSWPHAYFHFLDSPSFTPADQWLYLKLMQEHAIRLKTGLSKPERSGNWVTTECHGLYTIAVLFPELKEAPAWRQFAIDRLTRELDRMVPPDGFEAELTPTYHLVALAGFRGPVELAALNHLELPPLFRSKIVAMYRALVLVMDQGGNVVPTNDSDNVNAAKIARSVLKLFPDPLLDWAASGGKSGTPPPDSTMLPYAGFYAMRSGWKPDDTFLFFRAGPAGIGHEHEDMLEIVLRAFGQTLLPDPGRYPYDVSDWRRFTISTPSHSTIIVDGKWQHRGSGKPGAAVPVDNPWMPSPLFDFVAGTYDGGYQQSVYNPKKQYYPQDWVGEVDHSVTHTRRVLFLKPCCALVLDTLNGSGEHTVDSHFQLDAAPARIDPATQAAFGERPDGASLALYPLERDGLEAQIVEGQKEPLLGWMPNEHRAIPTVRFRRKGAVPMRFATFLYPYQGKAVPAFTARPLVTAGDDLWSRTFETARETAEVALVESGKGDVAEAFSISSALLGPVKVEAGGFVARRATGQADILAGGWAFSSYGDGKIAFRLAAPSSLLFVPKGDRLLFYNAGEKAVPLSITIPFTREAVLPPSAWTEVSASGIAPGTAPALP